MQHEVKCSQMSLGFPRVYVRQKAQRRGKFQGTGTQVENITVAHSLSQQANGQR